MTKIVLVFACALGMMVVNDVAADETIPVQLGPAAVAVADASADASAGHCTFPLKGALRSSIAAAEFIANAVKSCPAESEKCTMSILEVTSSLLKASSEVLHTVGCFTHDHSKHCPSALVAMSGQLIGLSLKITELAGGVCGEHAEGAEDSHDRRLRSASNTTDGWMCAAAVGKTLVPMTQLGLGLKFELEKCGKPENSEECAAIALELAAVSAGIVQAVVSPTGVLTQCGSLPINAHCAAAVTGLVEESLEASGSAIHLKHGCFGGEDHLRLYQDVYQEVKAPAQQLPWILSGFLLAMVPVAYVVGRRGRQQRFTTLMTASETTGISVE